ncbi:unnamed protein product, partial [Chrysoparadoxa australica]
GLRAEGKGVRSCVAPHPLMSLFSNFEGGDYWAGDGFVCTSSFTEILNKEDFTLEEVLEEDELLQEVKSLNTKLIEFLATDECVGQMVEYVARPARPDESESRRF